MTEICEKDGFKLDITFGESIPTIKDIDKTSYRCPIAEMITREPGEPGKDGKSIEFHWNGTQLGIRGR